MRTARSVPATTRCSDNSSFNPNQLFGTVTSNNSCRSFVDTTQDPISASIIPITITPTSQPTVVSQTSTSNETTEVKRVEIDITSDLSPLNVQLPNEDTGDFIAGK